MQMADGFEIGKVYFAFGFLDNELKYPVITSLVYIGQNLEGDEGRDYWFFQDIDSYSSKGGYTGGGEAIDDMPSGAGECAGKIYTYTTDSVGELLDLDGLIEELRRVKL